MKKSMNRQFMLNSLNKKFTSSSLKTKIELFLLPLLLLYFVYYSCSIYPKDDFQMKNNTNFDEYSKKEFNDSLLDFSSNLQDYALKNQIVIFNITNNKKVLFIKAKAKLQDIEKFIAKIEDINSFTNITFFTLNKQDYENYLFELNIDLNKFYIKKQEKQIIKEIKAKIHTNNEKPIEYKISGIISDYAFINDTWVKKDEKIDDFKLTKIQRNYIVLENENRKIKLELENENYLKKFN
jgi:hypothetical protein